jgi:hypothetical protein
MLHPPCTGSTYKCRDGWEQNKISINTIAQLLPEFDGTIGKFCIWVSFDLAYGKIN